MKQNVTGDKAHCYFITELRMIRKQGTWADIAWHLKFMAVDSVQTII